MNSQRTNLLAVETSTDACSVALYTQGEVIADHRLAAQQHAQLLLPMIDQLLSESGITTSQLDGVAFGCGPGSFTGVRIAAATAQGIAFGANVGVIAVSSLQALAEGAQRSHGATHVLSSFDARMGEVYWGAYVSDENQHMQSVIEDSVCAPADVPVPDAIANAQWALIGSGSDVYAAALIARVQPGIRCHHISDCWPDARDVLSLALPRAHRGEFASPEKAVPVYLRNRVALTTAERAEGQRL